MKETKKKWEINYVSTHHAASIANVSLVTIRNWLNRYGIGMKVAGRWKVDFDKLQVLLKGGIPGEENAKGKKAK